MGEAERDRRALSAIWLAVENLLQQPGQLDRETVIEQAIAYGQRYQVTRSEVESMLVRSFDDLIDQYGKKEEKRYGDWLT